MALSGETLSIHGDPLKRFKVSRLGQSVLVVPLKAKSEVVGLLVVVRRTATPFGPGNQALLEAVADYASISLVNARLFHALEERALSLQQAVEQTQASERAKDQYIKSLSRELYTPLMAALDETGQLLFGASGTLTPTQKEQVARLQEKLQRMVASLKPGNTKSLSRPKS